MCMCVYVCGETRLVLSFRAPGVGAQRENGRAAAVVTFTMRSPWGRPSASCLSLRLARMFESSYSRARGRLLGACR